MMGEPPVSASKNKSLSIFNVAALGIGAMVVAGIFALLGQAALLVHLATINALKHGDGKSYRQLIAKINDIEFDVEAIHTPVYEEGDVSAIRSFIKTDDAFMRR